ncbi:MAG: NTP transferase domain-containing protein [Candidatus Latescibacteria bacterium]|nr:NTP transferase domain-containing protein [Candidatus Latescibacterota bacterium]
MRAIILAAGTGTRLHPLTERCPKCLVPIGGKAIVDYQVEALRAHGVDDIVLVVGYEAEQVRAHFGARARYVENRDYARTNSIYSLYLARAELSAETFLFNCDILFHPQVLGRMLGAQAGNVVAVDSQVERVAGEMNVAWTGTGQVQTINKQLTPEQAQGQSAQLVKFDQQGAGLVAAEVERLIELDQRESFPTAAYGTLLTAGLLQVVEVGDLPHAEIDSLEDYEHARDCVLPRIPAC